MKTRLKRFDMFCIEIEKKKTNIVLYISYKHERYEGDSRSGKRN